MTRWQELTPAEVLNAYPALTLTQVAYVLGLVHQRGVHKGEPDRRLALELIHAGRLASIDSKQPVARLTVSAFNVRRYLLGEQAAA